MGKKQVGNVIVDMKKNALKIALLAFRLVCVCVFLKISWGCSSGDQIKVYLAKYLAILKISK